MKKVICFLFLLKLIFGLPAIIDFNDADGYLTNWDSDNPIIVRSNSLSTYAVSNQAVMVYGQDICCTPVEASNNYQYSWLVNNPSCPWVDISEYITDLHKARGFIDIWVTMIPTNNVWDGYELTTASNWMMCSDTDKHNNTDIMSSADGVTYDMIDTRYKSDDKDDPASAQNLKYKQLRMLRFAVPDEINQYYKLWFPPWFVRKGGSAVQKFTFQRVGFYMIKESVGCVPIPKITYPENVYRYDRYWQDEDERDDFSPWQEHLYFTVGVPITFDGTGSFNNTPYAIKEYRWMFYNGEKTGPVVTNVFYTKGTYTNYLVVENSIGQVFTNDGTDSPARLTGVSSVTDDWWPSPHQTYHQQRRPLVIEIVDAPSSNFLDQNRPNPFEPEKHEFTYFDFELKENTHISAAVYDRDGNVIKSLKNADVHSGYWTLKWNGKDENGYPVGRGHYYMRLETSSDKKYVKFYLLR